MPENLKGKVAIVTGSGLGIGRGIAIAIAREGARVITNNRKPGRPGGDAETVAREIKDMGGQAQPFFGDVSNFEVAGKLIQMALDKFGRLDILVNNAGNYTPTDPWDMTEAEWDRVIGVNLKSAFNCCRHAIPIMKEQRSGRLINCSSGSQLYSTRASHYAAAKGGIVGYTRALAADLGEYGITCNAYYPYAATTLSSSMERRAGMFWRRVELGLITKEDFEHSMKGAEPESIGPMVAYLATDQTAKINGKIFYASDGWFSIYTEPVKKKTIVKKNGIWTMEELIERVPKELLAGEDDSNIK